MFQRNRQARLRIRSSMMSLKKFSIQELQAACGASRTVVQRFVRDALNLGCLELIQARENGKASGDVYQLLQVPIVPFTPPTKRDSRSRAWTSMQILPLFSLPDLEISALISESNAKKYVQSLLQTGYLQVIRQRTNGSRDYNVYQLIRNSGPLAPILKRDGTVFDPNTNTLYTKEDNES